MKVVKINDNIKINIEMIYSLEHHDNQIDIDEWENRYKEYLEECSQDPPLLAISDDEVYSPVIGEEIDTDKIKLYTEALSEYIITSIGKRPDYIENYFIILATGLKINIDKSIYDKVNSYLDKFIEDN